MEYNGPFKEGKKHVNLKNRDNCRKIAYTASPVFYNRLFRRKRQLSEIHPEIYNPSDIPHIHTSSPWTLY